MDNKEIHRKIQNKATRNPWKTSPWPQIDKKELKLKDFQETLTKEDELTEYDEPIGENIVPISTNLEVLHSKSPKTKAALKTVRRKNLRKVSNENEDENINENETVSGRNVVNSEQNEGKETNSLSLEENSSKSSNEEGNEEVIDDLSTNGLKEKKSSIQKENSESEEENDDISIKTNDKKEIEDEREEITNSYILNSDSEPQTSLHLKVDDLTEIKTKYKKINQIRKFHAKPLYVTTESFEDQLNQNQQNTKEVTMENTRANRNIFPVFTDEDPFQWPSKPHDHDHTTKKQIFAFTDEDPFHWPSRPEHITKKEVFAFTNEDPFHWPSKPDGRVYTTKKKKKKKIFPNYKTLTPLPSITWKTYNFTENLDMFTSTEATETESTTTTTMKTSEISINFTTDTPPTTDIYDYDILTTTGVLVGPVNPDENNIFGTNDIDIATVPSNLDLSLPSDIIGGISTESEDLDVNVDRALDFATEETTTEDNIRDRQRIFEIADELLEDFTATSHNLSTSTGTVSEVFPHKINDNMPTINVSLETTNENFASEAENLISGQKSTASSEQENFTSTEKESSSSTEQESSSSTEQESSSVTEQESSSVTEQESSSVTEQESSSVTEQESSSSTEQESSSNTEQENYSRTEQESSSSTEKESSSVTEKESSSVTEQESSSSTGQENYSSTKQESSSSTEQESSSSTEQESSSITKQETYSSMSEEMSTSIKQESTSNTEQKNSFSAEQESSSRTEQQTSFSMNEESSINTEQKRSTRNEQETSRTKEESSTSISSSEQKSSFSTEQQSPFSTLHEISSSIEQKSSSSTEQQSTFSTAPQSTFTTEKGFFSTLAEDHTNISSDKTISNVDETKAITESNKISQTNGNYVESKETKLKVESSSFSVPTVSEIWTHENTNIIETTNKTPILKDQTKITKYYFEDDEPHNWPTKSEYLNYNIKKLKKGKWKDKIIKTKPPQTLPNVTWRSFNWTENLAQTINLTSKTESAPITASILPTTSSKINTNLALTETTLSDMQENVTEVTTLQASSEELFSTEHSNVFKNTTKHEAEISSKVSTTEVLLEQFHESFKIKNDTIGKSVLTAENKIFTLSSTSEGNGKKNEISSIMVLINKTEQNEEGGISFLSEQLSTLQEKTNRVINETSEISIITEATISGISSKVSDESINEMFKTKTITTSSENKENNVILVSSQEKEISPATNLDEEKHETNKNEISTKTEKPIVSAEAKEQTNKFNNEKYVTPLTSSTKINLNTGGFWKKFSWPTESKENEEMKKLEEELKEETKTTVYKKTTTTTTTTIKSFLDLEDQSEAEFTGLYIPEETTSEHYTNFIIFPETATTELNLEELGLKMASKNMSDVEASINILPKFNETTKEKTFNMEDNFTKETLKSGSQILTGVVTEYLEQKTKQSTDIGISKESHPDNISKSSGRPIVTQLQENQTLKNDETIVPTYEKVIENQISTESTLEQEESTYPFFEKNVTVPSFSGELENISEVGSTSFTSINEGSEEETEMSTELNNLLSGFSHATHEYTKNISEINLLTTLPEEITEYNKEDSKEIILTSELIFGKDLLETALTKTTLTLEESTIEKAQETTTEEMNNIAAQMISGETFEHLNNEERLSTNLEISTIFTGKAETKPELKESIVTTEAINYLAEKNTESTFVLEGAIQLTNNESSIDSSTASTFSEIPTVKENAISSEIYINVPSELSALTHPFEPNNMTEATGSNSPETNLTTLFIFEKELTTRGHHIIDINELDENDLLANLSSTGKWETEKSELKEFSEINPLTHRFYVTQELDLSPNTSEAFEKYLKTSNIKSTIEKDEDWNNEITLYSGTEMNIETMNITSTVSAEETNSQKEKINTEMIIKDKFHSEPKTFHEENFSRNREMGTGELSLETMRTEITQEKIVSENEESGTELTTIAELFLETIITTKSAEASLEENISQNKETGELESKTIRLKTLTETSRKGSPSHTEETDTELIITGELNLETMRTTTSIEIIPEESISQNEETRTELTKGELYSESMTKGRSTQAPLEEIISHNEGRGTELKINNELDLITMKSQFSTKRSQNITQNEESTSEDIKELSAIAEHLITTTEEVTNHFLIKDLSTTNAITVIPNLNASRAGDIEEFTVNEQIKPTKVHELSQIEKYVTGVISEIEESLDISTEEESETNVSENKMLQKNINGENTEVLQKQTEWTEELEPNIESETTKIEQEDTENDFYFLNNNTTICKNCSATQLSKITENKKIKTKKSTKEIPKYLLSHTTSITKKGSKKTSVSELLHSSMEEKNIENVSKEINVHHSSVKEKMKHKNLGNISTTSVVSNEKQTETSTTKLHLEKLPSLSEIFKKVSLEKGQTANVTRLAIAYQTTENNKNNIEIMKTKEEDITSKSSQRNIFTEETKPELTSGEKELEIEESVSEKTTKFNNMIETKSNFENVEITEDQQATESEVTETRVSKTRTTTNEEKISEVNTESEEVNSRPETPSKFKATEAQQVSKETFSYKTIYELVSKLITESEEKETNISETSVNTTEVSKTETILHHKKTSERIPEVTTESEEVNKTPETLSKSEIKETNEAQHTISVETLSSEINQELVSELKTHSEETEASLSEITTIPTKVSEAKEKLHHITTSESISVVTSETIQESVSELTTKSEEIEINISETSANLIEVSKTKGVLHHKTTSERISEVTTESEEVNKTPETHSNSEIKETNEAQQTISVETLSSETIEELVSELKTHSEEIEASLSEIGTTPTKVSETKEKLHHITTSESNSVVTSETIQESVSALTTESEEIETNISENSVNPIEVSKTKGVLHHKTTSERLSEVTTESEEVNKTPETTSKFEIKETNDGQHTISVETLSSETIQELVSELKTNSEETEASLSEIITIPTKLLEAKEKLHHIITSESNSVVSSETIQESVSDLTTKSEEIETNISENSANPIEVSKTKELLHHKTTSERISEVTIESEEVNKTPEMTSKSEIKESNEAQHTISLETLSSETIQELVSELKTHNEETEANLSEIITIHTVSEAKEKLHHIMTSERILEVTTETIQESVSELATENKEIELNISEPSTEPTEVSETTTESKDNINKTPETISKSEIGETTEVHQAISLETLSTETLQEIVSELPTQSEEIATSISETSTTTIEIPETKEKVHHITTSEKISEVTTESKEKGPTNFNNIAETTEAQQKISVETFSSETISELTRDSEEIISTTPIEVSETKNILHHKQTSEGISEVTKESETIETPETTSKSEIEAVSVETFSSETIEQLVSELPTQSEETETIKSETITTPIDDSETKKILHHKKTSERITEVTAETEEVNISEIPETPERPSNSEIKETNEAQQTLSIETFSSETVQELLSELPTQSKEIETIKSETIITPIEESETKKILHHKKTSERISELTTETEEVNINETSETTSGKTTEVQQVVFVETISSETIQKLVSELTTQSEKIETSISEISTKPIEVAVIEEKLHHITANERISKITTESEEKIELAVSETSTMSIEISEAYELHHQTTGERMSKVTTENKELEPTNNPIETTENQQLISEEMFSSEPIQELESELTTETVFGTKTIPTETLKTEKNISEEESHYRTTSEKILEVTTKSEEIEVTKFSNITEISGTVETTEVQEVIFSTETTQELVSELTTPTEEIDTSIPSIITETENNISEITESEEIETNQLKKIPSETTEEETSNATTQNEEIGPSIASETQQHISKETSQETVSELTEENKEIEYNASTRTTEEVEVTLELENKESSIFHTDEETEETVVNTNLNISSTSQENIEDTFESTFSSELQTTSTLNVSLKQIPNFTRFMSTFLEEVEDTGLLSFSHKPNKSTLEETYTKKSKTPEEKLHTTLIEEFSKISKTKIIETSTKTLTTLLEEAEETGLFNFSNKSEESTICEKCTHKNKGISTEKAEMSTIIATKSKIKEPHSHVEESTSLESTKIHKTSIGHKTEETNEHSRNQEESFGESILPITEAIITSVLENHTPIPFVPEVSDNILATLTEVSLEKISIGTLKADKQTTEENIPYVVTLAQENLIVITAVEQEETTQFSFTEVTIPKEHIITKSHLGTSPKIVVVIVNNSGKKINKVNETMLEKLLNKTLKEIHLEYMDLSNIAKEPNSKLSRSEENILKYGKTCKTNDFESNEQCICDIDSYLNGLEKNLNDTVDIKKLNCSKFVSFRDGFIITNETEPLKRKKRSLLYLKNLEKSTNFIENDNIDDILDDQYELKDSDTNTFGYPGRKTKIFCTNTADLLLDNQNVSFNWEFKKDSQEIGEILQFHENPLIIKSADLKTVGNYTCTETDRHGDKEKHTHELELISFPVYKIAISIYYSVNDSCSLSDADILFAYLPKIVGPVLCGESGKLCKIDMERPRCFTKDDNNFYNVTVRATMKDIHDVYPTIDDLKCNINCRLKAYCNLVKLVHKNAQNVKRIPVLSKLHANLDFLSNVTMPNGEFSKPPKIITTCREGYGIEKFKQRICVLCPKHTYSEENEVYCTLCPAGKYQPQPGSKSCLSCTSPVDDAMCLRMLYSNTKQFKIYVAIGFGVAFLIIAIIIMWKSSNGNNKNSKVGYIDPSVRLRNHKRRYRTSVDVENPLLEPLLDPDKKRTSPPDIPPPDF